MTDSLKKYIIRSVVFIALILLIVIFVYPVLQTAFLSNIYINLIIVISLFFGLGFSVYQLILLHSNYNDLANFNIHNSPKILMNSSNTLRGMANELRELDGRFKFKTSSQNKILESIDMNILSIRETSRYFVGLLVFLGLLGTFWGLLKTIGSVGDVISALGIDDSNVAGFFNSLKDGLNAPLQGMSVAFSSSLLGLAGSLILGFMDLNLGQAQNKFTQYVEKIISNNSSPDIKQISDLNNQSTLAAIQQIYDNLDNLVFTVKESSTNQNHILSYIQTISEQMKEINNNSRDQDKKISNFLSTQLNVQTNILQLTTQLKDGGLIDSKTKKNFENIDRGIQKLIAGLKKK